MTQRIYFPAIDGLRFLAFLFVFFRHFNVYTPSKFMYEIGWIGVELFFLISAFLLTRLLVEEYKSRGKVNTGSFFMRRILRIWPLYFAYLGLILLYSVLRDIDSYSLTRLIGNIFFVDNIISSVHYYNLNPFSLHLWSISMEEQFYLFLPFVIPWLVGQSRKKLYALFLTIFAIMILLRYASVFFQMQHPFIYVLPFSGDCFLAGILLGLGLFDEQLRKFNPVFCIIGAAAALYLVYLLPSKSDTGYHQVFVYTLTAIAFFLLLTLSVFCKKSFAGWLFQNKIAGYLGKISYGLYIFHPGGIYTAAVLCRNTGITDKKWQLPLAFVITLLAAVLSYELFEKIFLKKKKKYTVIENRNT